MGGMYMAQINVSNLTFCYEGSFDNIFEDVSFSIQRFEHAIFRRLSEPVFCSKRPTLRGHLQRFRDRHEHFY